MCIGCWHNQYGSPKIENDSTKKAVSLIKEVYEHSSVGGTLHIVLDDWNIEDHHLDYCSEEIAKMPSSDRREAEKNCCKILKSMTIEERASALAKYDKMF